VKFYGAFWCPHCQEQKAIFGDDMRYIDYVECDARDPAAKPEECAAKKVDRYPTWFFPGQGNETGLHEPIDLAKKVGCESTLGSQQTTSQTVTGSGLPTAQPGLTQSGLTQAPGAAAPLIPAVATQLTIQQ
jgi:thiol-disulfide isomerase/thioredoxin